MAYESEQTRWVLAYDAACGSCSRLSARIARACDGKLETSPLSDAQVKQWRSESLGAEPPWEPTLIRVGPDRVEAWTGRSIVLQLVRHLGLRSSLAVTFALGSLRNELAADDIEQGEGRGLTRKRFLQLGAGAMVAGSMIATGQVPAYASNPARAWVGANRTNLPFAYDDFSKYPIDYRREIYRELTPATRSKLWVEHLQRYRREHSDLSADQQDLLNEAVATASNPATFTRAKSRPTTDDERFERRAKASFGTNEAHDLFATLGPSSPSRSDSATAALCSCSIASDYCWAIETSCYPSPCGGTLDGCGTFYNYPCNGDCGPD